jgi:hypothetical protein
MGENEYEAAVAAFLRTKGVTRCPTACAADQGTIAATDRAALEIMQPPAPRHGASAK